jgi:hypothetical protein
MWDSKRLKKYIPLISIIPGFFAVFIYEVLYIFIGDNSVFSLFQKRDTVAQLTAGYAFTFLGFLLTIATVSVSLPNSYRIKRYKADGYFDIFIRILFVTAICLVIDLLLAILLLSNSEYKPFILKAMMAFFINSLVLSLFSFYIIFNLLTKRD